MKTDTLRVSQSFTKMNAKDLVAIARVISGQLYSDAAYTDIPVDKEVLDSEISALELAMEAQASGGTAATALKNQRMTSVAAVLRELALYVQVACKGNLAMLLASGFHAVSRNRAMIPLPAPVVLRIRQRLSGQAELSVKPVPTAKCYEVETALISGEGTYSAFVPSGIHTSSRGIQVNGLTPGQLYAYRVRAIGGSTGSSGWSDPTVQRVI